VTAARAPTIYVECTTTFRHDHGTGIPRVAHAIVRHLRALAPRHGYDVVPVYVDGRALRPATLAADGGLGALAGACAAPPPPSRARRAMDGLARAMPAGAARDFVAAPSSQPGLARLLRGASERLRARPSAATLVAPGDVAIGARDILLHADIDLGADYRALHAAMHDQGTPVCAVVYDLIPVRHPAIWPALPVRQFRKWLDRTIAGADTLCAISEVVRDDLARYIAETPGLVPPHGQAIEWFHLGHDMDASRDDDAPVRDSTRALFATDTPVLLCVGWLDPRKNQPRLIEAVATLQARGVAARLVLIGRRGFGTMEVMRALDAVAGRADVHLVDDASDAEVRHALEHARALVYPSYAEGFGLPLVEALRYRLPVLCSDIPIFREIAGPHAVYFDPFDVASIVAALEAFLVRGDYPPRALAEPFSWIAWEESVGLLLDLLLHARERATLQRGARRGAGELAPSSQ
jgi:glycosyltransferase involved in cell wall biosynthesis